MNAHRRGLRRSGPRTLGALTLALVVGSATLAGVTAATEQVASAASPSLSVSPHNYVGGQRLRWTGNVGHRGERRLVLQFNMGTATGGSWSTVDGFAARTRADGSFSFVHPAPSMFNIRYRVKAGQYVTPARCTSVSASRSGSPSTPRPRTSTAARIPKVSPSSRAGS